jgi:hypothetical protein
MSDEMETLRLRLELAHADEEAKEAELVRLRNDNAFLRQLLMNLSERNHCNA